MIKKTTIVKNKNGTVYTQTVTVYDTCEEYYSKGTAQDLKRKVRRIERFLDDLSYIEDHICSDCDCISKYRQMAETIRMEDEF